MSILSLISFGIIITAAVLPALAVISVCMGVRYIPHRRVGIIEKLWSPRRSLAEGQIIALAGEAGFQARVLRGGVHIGYPFWMYRVHTEPLVTIPEGRIGYVYARDGLPLGPAQTLGRVVESHGFQDPLAFLENGGQRGRQRAILREGVYAINTALFVVIMENAVYCGPVPKHEAQQCVAWQRELAECNGFVPVVIGAGRRAAAATGDATELMPHDLVGIVTVHDGPQLEPGEFIAPQVGVTPRGNAEHSSIGGGHSCYQDADAFLALGGRRGKQLQVLTDGTYFLNRWFATVELQPKTLIPIGYVGVVISYYGDDGDDVTGAQFRYGEHLASIPLITADGYEPLLPLSLVLHIDYEKAPRVVQRFGDVRRLITQTLDPILTAYFRDVAQASCMLDLLTRREDIQRRATEELGRRFQEFDITCFAVLIGRPEPGVLKPGAEDSIDRLFDQLRQRRLAEEQKETFAKQEEAAAQLKQLNHARAEADRQTALTETRVEIEIAGNRGAAQLAEAERLAKREVALAEGTAQANELHGQGEASKIAQVGEAEAGVSRQKIEAFTDPRLYAPNLIAAQLANSHQPLVPERVVTLGDGGRIGETGLFQSIMQVLMTWERIAEPKGPTPVPPAEKQAA